ncbi:hypothetical protein PRJ_5600 (plasmid) [Pseudomonas sp. XWY-1]|uniref:hypothetical protein n=1 Tax=Pseudomonas sp. XWY-1 TaxID=2069256 RepID=UPI000CDBE50B|nr:hypothetical protein [Pseudomonas sp. XWY-1]AUZ62158.1 hypothetical protein PRJ_5600 [Pseudomonas sp. XWY-1]
MPLPKRKNMTLREQETAAKAQCHDWNTAHPEGAAVLYEELLGSGEKIQTRTCGKAFVMCCEPVIMVDDVSGAVSLDHCTVVTEHAAA